MSCANCIFHDILWLKEGDDLIFDGCMCTNAKAELKNMHTECCEEYEGKCDCPYKK